MKKEVTIIIPTYNDTYEKMDLSLKSIAEQHYNLKKVEVIIIDDASTNYKFTINEFKKKYPILEIKYFRQYQNTGPGLARQIGLDNATGEYIFFLDCGDYLYDLDVLHKFEKIQKKNYDIYAFLVYLDGMALSYYDGNSFIFGLFIKRNFILKHHIRFSKILRWEEDSYFYGLLESYNPKVKEEIHLLIFIVRMMTL